MGKRNGYFQLSIDDKSTSVILYPPQNGGEPISLDELRMYLESKGLRIDPLFLKQQLQNHTQEKVVLLAQQRIHPCQESFSVKVLDNNMTAVARFYPFSSFGSALTLEDIVKELNFQGIKRGIDENEISGFLSDKHYCTDYIVAMGEPVRQGSDAGVEYFFNTNPNQKPSLKEDGTVDFFNLSAISKVSKGQVLAKLTDAVPGVAGFNVYGDEIKPREVKQCTLKCGMNIELSEDGHELTTLVDGHASLVGDKVFVSNVYAVKDVDTSTGNIEYDGSVTIEGNVKSGFSVKAKGNVEVKGVVEAATIEAEGDIIIARGMNGMGKGVLKGRNIIAKFLENATVFAEGYVEAEAIMQSSITAAGDVESTGKKGFIAGGIVRSKGTVVAKTIGSTMGVVTEIEVGSDPKIKLQIESLMQQINDEKKKIAQIEPVVITLMTRMKKGDKLTDDQTRYLRQLSNDYKVAKEHLTELEDSYLDLEDAVETDMPESVVKVEEFAYPGTRITVSGVSTTLSTAVSHGRFVKDGADVRVKGL